MKKWVLGIFLALFAYLLFWPVAIDPKPWAAPAPPALKGVYAVNSKLANFQALTLNGLSGPEAVTQDLSGNIYASTHEGWILKWPALSLQESAGDFGSIKPEKLANVGGRPLGIAVDANQNLWIANAYLGLQKLTPSGELTTELDTAEGVAIRYADDLAITPDGKIYFSDATTKFAAEDHGGTLAASKLSILEHGGHGRVIEFDPTTRVAKVIMTGLTFANGVAAAGNGDYILVAETGSYRVWKHWLQGEKAGISEVLLDNLPGFPDNIHLGVNGRYWLGFTTIRQAKLDAVSDKPFLRKIIARLPDFLQPGVEPHGHIIAFSGEGEVLESLQDPQGSYPAATGAWETENYLYVSSLTAKVLARIKKSGLEKVINPE